MNEDDTALGADGSNGLALAFSFDCAYLSNERGTCHYTIIPKLIPGFIIILLAEYKRKHKVTIQSAFSQDSEPTEIRFDRIIQYLNIE